MDDNIIKCIVVLLLVAALLSFWSIFATEAEDINGAAIYIKSSPGAICPGEPCYTLSQFATSQNRLQFNTSLLLLSGNYSLNSYTFIADINYFSMLTFHSSSSISIIHCQHNASISLSNISTVMIHGLAFYGCGNNKISSVDKLTIQSCSFFGSEKSATALNIIHSNADFINCFFLSNRIGTYHGPILILEHLEEPSYTNFTLYAFVGGALIANQSNVYIVESEFEKNHAGVGGAIYSTLGSQIIVINSTFTENSVCLLLYQNEYPVCFGGVLFCENQNSQVEVINSDFTYNFGNFGGVFTLFDHCTISINSSRFSENLAINYSGNGGVLYLQDGVTASIHKSLFFNNSALSAGGAVRAEHSILKIRDSEFTNHSVRQFGGVIYMINGSLTIDRSYFRYNGAFQGGVLNIFSQCSVTIRDSEFSNNEAMSDVDPFNAAGGVISMMQSSALIIVRTLFYNNKAQCVEHFLEN